MNDQKPRPSAWRLTRVSRFGGLVARVAFVLFGVEAAIMVVFELIWPHVRTWHHLFFDLWILAIATATTLYFSYIRPLDRKLAAALKDLRLSREKAERLAQFDYLTGVLNRSTLFARFQQEWQKAERNGTPLSCVMLDLDFFKQINDTYGHLAGDAALRMVADVLKTESRAYDHVGRYGGEEFCVLLPDTTEQEAAAYAERVRKAIAATPVMHADTTTARLTASLGVAQQDERMTGVEDLVHRADLALLRAKRSGRNRVESSTASNRDPQLTAGSKN